MWERATGNATDWLAYAGRAANGETVTGRVFENSFGQWMEYIASPSTALGCCNIVFWPVEDTKNERDLRTKGHAADNAIIRIARFLNTGDLDIGINKSLSELGRVLSPDRVFMLSSDGTILHEWCNEGVLPRKNRGSAGSQVMDVNPAKFAFIEDNCIVVNDVELFRKIDPKTYEFLIWEGIRSFITVPLFGNDNEVMGFVGVDNFNKDETGVTRRLLEEISYFISSRLIANSLLSRLNSLINHDELTGLYNRRGYDFLLNNVDIDTSALVLIDLNEFKKINDTYGHDVGDRALIKVANVLNRNFRAHDFVCRIGGDEFAVIMIHTEPELKDKIAAKVKNINASLKADAQKEDLPPISLSAGVVFGELHHSISEIYKQADNALYKAKADSGHDVIFAGFNS